MNNVTLTINLSADDRARLDKIIELLEQPALPRTAPEIVQRSKADGIETTLAMSPGVIEFTCEEAPKEEVKITPEQIQQKVIQLCATGTKKDKTREIVNAYAPKVSAIPEDKRAEVWEKLLTLEAEA